MVNALLTPSEGEVLVDGRATTAWNPIELRRSIGYVIQETGLFPHFTVAENVGLVPTLEGWPAADVEHRVERLLGDMGLPPSEYLRRYQGVIASAAGKANPERDEIAGRVLSGAVAGVVHSAARHGELDSPALRAELIELVCSYLRGRSAC